MGVRLVCGLPSMMHEKACVPVVTFVWFLKGGYLDVGRRDGHGEEGVRVGLKGEGQEGGSAGPEPSSPEPWTPWLNPASSLLLAVF